MIITAEKVQKYLSEIHQKEIELKHMSKMGVEPKKEGAKEIKGYGYGEPLLLEVEINGESKKFVLHTVKPGKFGHQHPSDRAKMLFWAHQTYNDLPNHVRSIDVGAFKQDGSLQSLGGAEEFFLLTEYVPGTEYFKDLERIGTEEKITKADKARAQLLADYIADIHNVKKDRPNLYVRRIRELLGHGEAIMGLLDTYDPKADFLAPKEPIQIEKKCVEWRWKIKNRAHRLCQVHGDFHPWNVKFRNGRDFTVLDRSRGEWGEAADDVSAMAINYLFFSLQKYGRLKGAFKKIWNIFLDQYLQKTGDKEMMEVIAPFFAWRGLVVASPIWYPNLRKEIRRKILNFIHNVLETEVFDHKDVNAYLKGIW